MKEDGRTLPQGWTWTTIGKIVEKMSNGTTKRQNKKGRGIPVTRIETISNGDIDLRRVRHIEGLSDDVIEKYRLQKGDVLFSHINSDLHLGKTAIFEMSKLIIHGMNLLLLRPVQSVIVPRFLHYLCNHYRFSGKFISVAQHAVNQSSINQTKLKHIEIPLPPLSEQHRIVAEIEKQLTRLDAGVTALQRAQANLHRYKAAVLKAACEGRLVPQDPVDEPASALLQRILTERRQRWEVEQIARSKDPKKRKYKEPAPPDTSKLRGLPEGWVWATLEQILIDLKNGYFGGRPSDEPIGVPILRINAVRPMSVSFDVRRYLPEVDTQKIRDYELEEGDLLFTRYNGSRNLAGACGLVRISEKPLLYPDKLIRVRVGRQISPNYLEAFFVSTLGRFFIEQKLKTTAGQYGIAGNDLKQIPIPIPPLCEQQRIVAEVERRLSVVEELEAAVEANLKRAERLRQAVLKRAFEGKLVLQDPNDEPASFLLERIRAEREKRGAEGKNKKKASRGRKRERDPGSGEQLRLL